MSEINLPSLNIPSGATAKVSIIDSTSWISGVKVSDFAKPPVAGFMTMPALPSYSFLVEHSSGRKILFDLGVRKDWEAYAPVIVNGLAEEGWDVRVEKSVSEILEENGVAVKNIDSIVWSHWHWDHLGDPSLFPSTTEVVVGPGFKKAFLPGWPAKQDSPVRESDFDGRQLREIGFDFSSTVKIGNFKAVDFFGDGSFYLLDSPGHAIGHLAGLARTTSDSDANGSTFIFMGGDVCHHCGEIRPSEYRHLPSSITPHPLQPALQHSANSMVSCPGAVFEELNKRRGRNGGKEAFYVAATGFDIVEANLTLAKIQEVDANDNIFFIMAHDNNLPGAIEVFPQSANEWKAKGWAEKVRWTFLKDFKEAVENPV